MVVVMVAMVRVRGLSSVLMRIIRRRLRVFECWVGGAERGPKGRVLVGVLAGLRWCLLTAVQMQGAGPHVPPEE